MDSLSIKQALIVDDSKLARYLLQNMLEEQGISVKTANSAEEALALLCAQQADRFDVIFMDQKMPGMKGLQAVKAIKSDPQTAMIPVLMYTSEEGEVFAAKARTFGAVGVLPKKLKKIELKKILTELNILKQKTHQQQASSDKSNSSKVTNPINNLAANSTNNVTPITEIPKPAQPDYDGETKIEEFITPHNNQQHYNTPAFEIDSKQNSNDLNALARNAIESFENKSFRSMVKRLFSETNEAMKQSLQQELQKKHDKLNLQLEQHLEKVHLAFNAVIQSNRQRSSSNFWLRIFLLSAIILLPSAWLITQYKLSKLEKTYEVQINQRQGSQHAKFTQVTHQNNTEISNPNESELSSFSPNRKKIMIKSLEKLLNSMGQFSYQQSPFNDQQAQTLQATLAILKGMEFTGKISLTSHLAQYCLIKDNNGQWVLPDSKSNIDDCTVWPSSALEIDTMGLQQSIAFSNFLSGHSEAETAISIELNTQSFSDPLLPYPTQNSILTAGEWNAIAQQNQRIIYTIKASQNITNRN